jgi:orotidine-5'-phosphate decarboxylase
MLPTIFIAIDTQDLAKAKNLAEMFKEYPIGLKLGLEFISSQGVEGIKAIQKYNFPIFLDTKFHDIPNTVAKAVDATVKLEPTILNIHASGGPAMMQAAKEARDEAVEKYNLTTTPKLIAVTALTSMDDESLAQVGQQCAKTQVLNLAKLAKEAGLDGVVCSANETQEIQDVCGNNFLKITPGIRLKGDNSGDQKRITTPETALNNCSNVLVIGRSITGAKDPVKALETILATVLSIQKV